MDPLPIAQASGRNAPGDASQVRRILAWLFTRATCGVLIPPPILGHLKVNASRRVWSVLRRKSHAPTKNARRIVGVSSISPRTTSGVSATSNAGVKESSDASFNAAISQVMLCLDIPSLTKLLKNPFATLTRSLPIRDRAEPLTVVVRQMVVALRVVFANARPDSENPTVPLRMFKSKSTNIPKGSPGNVVEVTWTSVGGAKKILLNVPGQDAPIVLTTAKALPKRE